MQKKFFFKALFNQDYTLNTHEITKEFNDLSINTDTADIIFAKSNDGQCKVECFESEKITHSVPCKTEFLR
jgi:hypothetical protein